MFKGLHLENHWDWHSIYPIIYLNFGASSSYHSKERFFTEVHNMLDQHADKYGVVLKQTDYGAKFGELIRGLNEKYAQEVVVLVDEYDKPILDNIVNSMLGIEMREILRGLYTYIKQCDNYIKFTLLTGVSKFSKISLFSDLNHLLDITLDTRYADICGYNQAELMAAFGDHLQQGKVDYELLKRWYNGYNFTGADNQKVYNPFDVLLFIDSGFRYRNYWFETATPTFLVKMVEKNRYFIPDFENIVVGEHLLKTFDVDNMPIETLLFQTGYLTIKEAFIRGQVIVYRLGYPNYEVKYSLNNSLAAMASNDSRKNQVIDYMINALERNDFKRLGDILCSHFASIPNDWYRNNTIEQYEGFYASIVYSFMVALGYELIAENVTNHGKIDLTLIMPDKVCIIEFKLKKHGDAKAAIRQIKEKNYAQKYGSSDKPIYLIGISFDPQERNLVDLLAEQC